MTVVGTASANLGLRLPTWSAMLLIFASAFLLVPSEALGKGGSSVHEGVYASTVQVPNFELRLPNETSGAAGAAVIATLAPINAMVRAILAIEATSGSRL